MSKKLKIFVHRASECLTDHESHGDGLICFALLNGLAERGHQIYAYTNFAPIRQCSPNLHVKTGQHKVPANSLAPWEQSWRANAWMTELERTTQFDLVWRMHPYHGGCPTVPKTEGKPLVVGPLFYGWPEQPGGMPKSGQPRLGVGLQGIVKPISERGWQRTLSQAALILCATKPHVQLIQAQHPQATVRELPVIVEAPPGTRVQATRARLGRDRTTQVSLLFVANLFPNKNPKLFVEIIQRLHSLGINAVGTVLGEGPLRAQLEDYVKEVDMGDAVCFQGKVPNSEVYPALADADFLVSLSNGEPYGRGIAEGMSVGTPAICHRSGGPADFIDDGVDGLLVNNLAADSYAARIHSALVAPGAWSRLSDNAQQKANAWCADIVLDDLEAALYESINKARGKVQ